MRRPLVSLALLALVFTSFAQHTPESSFDPAEIRFGKGTENYHNNKQQIFQESLAWKAFLSVHGTWYAHFNELSGLPHKAYGNPIAVSGADALNRATQFITQELMAFGVSMSELEFTGMTNDGKYDYVRFRQVYNGLEVLSSRVAIKLLDDKVVQFTCDVFHPEELSLLADINNSSASNIAVEGLEGTVDSIQSDGILRILAPQNSSLPNAHLVYTFDVSLTNAEGIPAKYYTLVDAHSGQVLYRMNQVRHIDGEPTHPVIPSSTWPGVPFLPEVVTADITADYYLTNPWDAPVNGGLPNIYVTVLGTNYQADQNGSISIPVNPGASAQINLQGPWAKVFTNGVTPQLNYTLQAGNNAISFNANANIKELTAYHSVQLIHDHMKLWMPTFTGMDFQLPTNVDVAGTCNAFYDGSSINFYAQGGGCNPTSLTTDIAFHEYGHGINDNYYQSQGGSFNNGAMGEAYADFWALSKSNSPILGTGFYIDNLNPIRRYDGAPKVYPVDIMGQVHNDGEILMGAWYDTHLLLGADWNITMPLFVSAYAGLQAEAFDGNEGQAYTDVLIDVLQADDNDGDITNGTPNGNAIVQGFYIHGITLLSNASLFHNDIEFAPANTDIPLTASLTIQFPFLPYLQDVQCHYRINNGDWVIVPMDNTGGTNYAISIPQQPAGTVIAYYMSTLDINNTFSNVQPIGAHESPYPNLPYFILIGVEQVGIQDSDNNEDWGQWQTGIPGDNATTGIWDLEIPVQSATTDVAPGTVVQPGTQITAGGEYCFITGNASSEVAGIGENDVDGGHTTLQSPTIDMTAYEDPIIAYWRWYTNSPPGGANPGADWFQVRISNNGGQSWTYVENTTASELKWRRNAFRVADYVTPTAQMRFQFIASDSTHIGENLDGGSLVEAAMDDFVLYDKSSVSVSEIETSQNGIRVFPNPASDGAWLNFTLKYASSTDVQVTNLLGQVVYSSHWGNVPSGEQTRRVEWSLLAKGNYIIEILSEKETLTSRLIIE